jgi:hypothetical protein
MRNLILSLTLLAVGCTLPLGRPPATAPDDPVAIPGDDLPTMPLRNITVALKDRQSFGPDEIFLPYLTEVVVPVNWQECNPAPGRYDWSGLDTLIAAYHAKGVKVMLRFSFQTATVRDEARQGYPEWLRTATPADAWYTIEDKHGQALPLPKLWHPDIKAEIEWFIVTSAGRYGTDGRIGSVWIAGGHIGQWTLPTNGEAVAGIMAGGWTQERWLDCMRWLNSVGAAAYPGVRLVWPVPGGAHRGCFEDQCATMLAVAGSQDALEKGWSLQLTGLGNPAHPVNDVLAAWKAVGVKRSQYFYASDDWFRPDSAAQFGQQLDELLGYWDQLGRVPKLVIILLDHLAIACNPEAGAEYSPAYKRELDQFRRGR